MDLARYLPHIWPQTTQVSMILDKMNIARKKHLVYDEPYLRRMNFILEIR